MKPTITTVCHRAAVANDQPTTLQMLVRLEAPTQSTGKRPTLNLGMALDRSTSMAGIPIQRLREASLHLMSSLAPTDLLSAISFDSQLEVLAPAREASQQGRLKEVLRGLEVRGSTNLYGGLELSASEVHKVLGQRQLDRQILLTDGHPTEGITDFERLVKCVKKWKTLGVTTTAVGLGLHYNEDLLAELASEGGGNFYHLEHAHDIAAFFELELNGLARTFAKEVDLSIEPLGGVELLRVFNTLKSSEDGSLRLGDLLRGVPLELAVEFQVPAMPKPGELVRFHLRYREVESGKREATSTVLELPVVPFGQLTEFPINPAVGQRRALQLAANAIEEAIKQIDQRNFDGAKATLNDGLRVLGEAETSPDLDGMSERIQDMLRSLEQRQVMSARKQGKFTSVSYSAGSVSSMSFIKDYMKLPESERTPEKLKEMMDDQLGDSKE